MVMLAVLQNVGVLDGKVRAGVHTSDGATFTIHLDHHANTGELDPTDAHHVLLEDLSFGWLLMLTHFDSCPQALDAHCCLRIEFMISEMNP